MTLAAPLPAVRTLVYETFAREGRPPSPAELSATLQLTPAEVAAALRALHDAHALVLTRAGDGIRMAHPFSAWPMGFIVRDGDRLWWGGCAWDSFGIVAVLRRRLEILTTCPGCGRELRYSASPADPPDADLVVRLPRPAARWWDDVVDTCTHIRAYCDAGHAGDPGEGAIVELERMWALAQPWYGDRLEPDWEPHSRERNQALLEAHGMTGPFWRLA